MSSRKKLLDEHSKYVEQYSNASTELNSIKKAKELDNMLTDKSLNTDMNRIMKFFETFFDEESGNTREQGIKQVEELLEE
jgi:predicted solute-binding protein